MAQMVTMPDLGLEGPSLFLAVIISTRYFLLFSALFCTRYFVRNPDTTDNKHHTSSAGCVLQSAGYNALHAFRPPAEQEATYPVVYPRWIAAAFYSVVVFSSDSATCRAGGLCWCVIFMHACPNRCNTTGAAPAAVRFSWAAECDREFHFSPFFGTSFSISVNWMPLLLYCCVPCVTRVCAVCAVCHACLCGVLYAVCRAWSAFKPSFLSAVHGFVQELHGAPWAPQQRYTFTY